MSLQLRSSLSKLEQSSINWSTYLNSNQNKVESIKRELHPYQEGSVYDVLAGFRKHDRGQLIMACGTGKTFTSMIIAARLVATTENKLVLFLVPSLSLLSQILTDWKHYSEQPITAFAVCSDNKIGKRNEDTDFTAKDEIAYHATTDPEKLAHQVQLPLSLSHNAASVDLPTSKLPPKQHLGMIVIFSTYQSIDVVAVAQHKYGMPDFDLVICDEAHRTTGCYTSNEDKFTDNSPVIAMLKAEGVIDAEGAFETADIIESEDLLENNIMLEDLAIPAQEPSSKPPKKSKSKLGIVESNLSCFTFVHNAHYLKAKKRLYMTATPKIFVDRNNQKDGINYDVFSMENQDLYGPVFQVLNFSKAVQLGCLVDYKVLVLVIDGRSFPYNDQLTELNQTNKARIVGAWKFLNKYGTLEDLQDDPLPIKRAVGFAQLIDSNRFDKVASKKFSKYFKDVINNYVAHIEQEVSNDTPSEFLTFEYDFLKQHPLHCECKHIDGQMDAVQKTELINWLKEEPNEDQAKILFNVRCLSEGIDIPSLDAVIFFSPRKGQADVIQAVGRVMRKALGKQRGYIIVPVVVKNTDINEVVKNTPEFKVVWDVLMALKSLHPKEELFDHKLNKIDPRIQIVCEQSLIANKSPSFFKNAQQSKDLDTSLDFDGSISQDDSDAQAISPLHDLSFVEAIKSAIVTKLGNRKSWELWAKDVAQICYALVKAINKHLHTSPELMQKFNSFKVELSNTLRTDLSEQDVIEMMSQHIVVKPVMDELFKGFPFTEKNPIAHSLTREIQLLDKDDLLITNRHLKEFYESVALRMCNITTLKDRQALIIELFDNFFKKAFPKQQEKLGIVYTPVEVVHFINHSVNDILKQEFGQSLAALNVHILDPFTGTGTFITHMLLDQDLIPDDALERKYRQELHAYEIMPLAYYVASINIESAFVERTSISSEDYQPNNITVLTDTFVAKKDHKNATDNQASTDIDLARNKQLRDNV